MRALINLLFGCSCSNLSRVFTLARDGQKHNYQVCLDCGAEYEYDLHEMRIKFGAAIHSPVAPRVRGGSLHHPGLPQ